MHFWERKNEIRDSDEKSAGCGILVKKERDCGIRTSPSRPCGTSLARNKLVRNKDAFGCESEVIWFHESESKYAPVPGRGYAPAKIFGGGGGLNWCPSIHYRENVDFTPAGIRVAFSYRRTQLLLLLVVIAD